METRHSRQPNDGHTKKKKKKKTALLSSSVVFWFGSVWAPESPRTG